MNQKTKYALACVAKVLVFLALFASLYLWSRDVLRDKTSSEAISIVMKQPKNSFDVVLAGPSHMQHAVHPAQLFGEQGIVSCNVSTSAQSIPTSYYVIRESINRHDPELVVLDLFCLFYPDVYFSTARFHQAVDAFPLSGNKIEAVWDLAADNKGEYLLNYLLYHERWKSLTRYDFVVLSKYPEKYQLLEGTEVFPEPFVPVDRAETAPIPEIPLTYLKKIVDLCRETDTQLLLTVVPYRADVDNNDTSAVLQQKMYNQAALLAEEWGVDFLNGLHYLEEMNFDFTTDMLEYSHVNVSGSPKITAFYGQYLAEHYDLPDRREDAKYADWHEAYSAYLAKVEELLA